MRADQVAQRVKKVVHCMSEGNCEFLNLMGNCYCAYMDLMT